MLIAYVLLLVVLNIRLLNGMIDNSTGFIGLACMITGIFALGFWAWLVLSVIIQVISYIIYILIPKEGSHE